MLVQGQRCSKSKRTCCTSVIARRMWCSDVYSNQERLSNSSPLLLYPPSYDSPIALCHLAQHVVSLLSAVPCSPRFVEARRRLPGVVLGVHPCTVPSSPAPHVTQRLHTCWPQLSIVVLLINAAATKAPPPHDRRHGRISQRPRVTLVRRCALQHRRILPYALQRRSTTPPLKDLHPHCLVLLVCMVLMRMPTC